MPVLYRPTKEQLTLRLRTVENTPEDSPETRREGSMDEAARMLLDQRKITWSHTEEEEEEEGRAPAAASDSSPGAPEAVLVASGVMFALAVQPVVRRAGALLGGLLGRKPPEEEGGAVRLLAETKAKLKKAKKCLHKAEQVAEGLGAQLAVAFQALEDERAAADGANRQREEARKRAAAEVANLQAQIKALQYQTAEVSREQLESVKRAKEMAEAEIKALQVQLADAEEQARKDTLGQSDRIKAAVAQFEVSGTMLKKRETEVAMLEDQLAAARSDSKANKEYSDQVYQELKLANTQAETLETLLIQRTKERDDLQVQVDKLPGLTREAGSLETQLRASTVAELSAVRKELSSLTDLYARTSEQLLKMTGQEKATSAKCEAALANLNTTQAELAALHAKFQELERCSKILVDGGALEREKLTEMLMKAEEAAKATAEELAKREKESAARAQEMHGLKGSLSRAEADLHAALSREVALQQQTREMQDYKSKYLSVQQSMELYETDNVSLRASVTQLSGMEEKYSASLQDLADAKDRVAQLEVELAQQGQMEKELKDQIKAISFKYAAELQGLRDAEAAKAAEVASKTKELEEAKAQREELAATHKSEVAKLNEDNVSMLEDLRAALAIKSAECTDLENKLTYILGEDLEAKQREVAEKQRQLEKSKAESMELLELKKKLVTPRGNGEMTPTSTAVSTVEAVPATPKPAVWDPFAAFTANGAGIDWASPFSPLSSKPTTAEVVVAEPKSSIV